MGRMEADSVSAIVTDPPYGLGFMGKAWDHGVPACPFWAEMLRVAAPSAYLLAFGGTRTVHRMTVAIEDAGWVIRDILVWGYATGFPKSKASLKPAWEPIVMARKPGPAVQLNIDACRIPAEPWSKLNGEAGSGFKTGKYQGQTGLGAPTQQGTLQVSDGGRWPANVVLTDPIFDGGIEGVEGGGETYGGGRNHVLRRGSTTGAGLGYGSSSPEGAAMVGYDDSGTYSRFFLIPKAARAERDAGLSGGLRNNHPTVKPLALMRHLVRLVTPAGGIVLDPFLGSGTTALAAEMEGFGWVGIEREAEYVAIARERLSVAPSGLGL